MAHQWKKREFDQYHGQPHNGYYNPGFEEDVDRRHPDYHFKRNSYPDVGDEFDSPDYQDPELFPSSGFDSPRNRDFDLRNGHFHSSRNGDFNLQRNRDSDSPGYRDFNSPRNREFDSSMHGDFDSPRNGNFDLPRNGDFDSPRNGDFDLPRNRNFESPRSRDFDSPRSSNFTSSMSQDFQSPRAQDFSSKHVDERLYRGTENDAYRDSSEEIFRKRITPTTFDKQSQGFGRENRESEPFNQRYDYMDTGFRRRNHEITESSESDGETFNARIDHSQQKWDGRETLVVRKRKTGDNADQQYETVSESSSLKPVSRERTSRLSAYVHTLPSNERRTKTLQARKLEALCTAKNLGEYTEIYRDQILQEPVQSTQGLLKYHRKKAWQNFKQQTKNVLYQLELWSGAFKEIEGHFGTSVMTYFKFMRWLLFLNFYMMVIMLGLTILPHLLRLNHPSHFYETVPANITNSSGFHEEAVNCTEQYMDFLSSTVSSEGGVNKFLDVLQGTGWMEDTVLFYGTYFNKTYHEVFSDEEKTYNMSLSYLLATGAAFLVSFFLIVKNSAKGVKSTEMDEGSGQMIQFCNKVFGGWDFCISDKTAAKEKHKNLLQELRGDLDNQKLLWKKENRTKRERAKLYSVRIVVNIVVLGFLIGSLILIYYCNSQLTELKKLVENESPILQTIIEFLPSVTITVLNVIVPIIFNKLVPFEDYMPYFEMQITLLRTVILRLASLLVLMISLSQMVEKENEEYISKCGNQRWEFKMNSTNTSDSKEKIPIKCWETYVGQQIYKLVILDFLVPFVLTFIVEYPRRLVYQRFKERFKVVDMIGQQEFDLPKAVLDLVYTQTLCWMGLFFCPLIPLMAFVKCFIFFYVKKGTVLNNCIQPVRPFRTSKSTSLFIAVLFISFIISAGPITYMIGTIPPSQSCGPFRVYSVSNFVFFDTIRNLILTFPFEARVVFNYLGTMAFFLPAMVIVCFIMYCYCMQSIGYKRKAKLLRNELILEGKDRQFLLARVNEAWMYLEG